MAYCLPTTSAEIGGVKMRIFAVAAVLVLGLTTVCAADDLDTCKHDAAADYAQCLRDAAAANSEDDKRECGATYKSDLQDCWDTYHGDDD
jgi:hypothetical protein